MKLNANAKVLAATIAEATQFCTATGLDSCVNMVLDGNILTVRSRTERNGYIENLDVSGSEDGNATVPAKRLLDILNQIPAEDTELSDKDGNLVIKQKGIRFRLKCADAGNHFKLEEPEKWADLPAGFGTMIPRIAFASSSDASKPAMTGIRFQRRDGKLDIVATDGRRLCIGVIDTDCIGDMTLPASFALLMAKRDAGSFSVANGLAWFRKGERTWISTLLTPAYPAYLRVIPEIRDDSVRVRISVAEFADAVRRITILSDSRYHYRIKLEVRDGQLTVSSFSDAGTAKETISCESTADTEMYFQSRYISDVIKAVTGTHVTLIRSGLYSPVVFLCDDPDWKAVVMPMNCD